MKLRLAAGLVMLAAVALELAIPAPPPTARASTVPRTTPVGMAGARDLQHLETVTGFKDSQLEQQAFAAPGLLGPYNDDPVSGLAVPANMVIFRSYAKLKTAVADHRLPAGTIWVGLDLERWPGTPLWQQKRPTYTESLAERVVHNHGLKLLNTPGVDLLTSMGYHQTMHNYLDVQSDYVQGLAAGAAKYGDAVDIQAQRWERNPGTSTGNYAWLVGKATSEARHANKHVRVLAGLSTCPDNTPTNIPAQQVVRQQASMLLTDYKQTSVDGYWLNVPDWSNCPTGNPESGVDFLQNIYPKAQAPADSAVRP